MWSKVALIACIALFCLAFAGKGKPPPPPPSPSPPPAPSTDVFYVGELPFCASEHDHNVTLYTSPIHANAALTVEVHVLSADESECNTGWCHGPAMNLYSDAGGYVIVPVGYKDIYSLRVEIWVDGTTTAYDKTWTVDICYYKKK